MVEPSEKLPELPEPPDGRELERERVLRMHEEMRDALRKIHARRPKPPATEG